MERQQTKHQPDSRCLRVIYNLNICFLGIILPTFSIIASAQLTSSFDDYDYIISNWNQNVLTNVQISFSNCQTLGNGYTPLATYQWPGTNPGCDCRYQARQNATRELEQVDQVMKPFKPSFIFYTNHACNTTQKNYNCKTISSKGSQTFDKWTDASTPSDFYVCGTRLEGRNFFNNLPQSNQCPDGQKRCGSRTDENLFYCMPSAEQCPITQIGFSGLDNKQWKSQPIPSKVETIKINENFQLWYSREDQLPIVEIRITESDGVCLRNNETNISPDRSDYLLMQTWRDSCSTDPRFKELHSIDEQSFYRVNNGLDFSKEIKGYQISSNYKWGIFARPFIDWKMSCRGEMYKQFLDFKATLESIKQSQMGLLIFSLVFFATLAVMLIAIFIATVCGYDWPCRSWQEKDNTNQIFTCEIVTKEIFQISYAVVVLIAFSKVRDAINFFVQIIDMGCSDSTTNTVLQSLIDVLQEEVQTYNIVHLILFVITTIIDVSISIIYFVRMRRDTKSKYQTEMVNTPVVKGQELQIVQPEEYQPVPQINIQMQQNDQDNAFYRDHPQLNNNHHPQPNMNDSIQQQQMSDPQQQQN